MSVLLKKSKQSREVQLNTENPTVVAYTQSLPPFTGIARSVQCFNTNGAFRNFRVLTFHVVEDVIVKTIYSDPYAQWEAIDYLDGMNDKSLIHLNTIWSEGKCLEK